jgi:hypothetical protein
VILALIYSLVYNLYLTLIYKNTALLLSYFTFLIISTCIFFIIWLLKIWTAGDSKLAIAFAVLLFSGSNIQNLEQVGLAILAIFEYIKIIFLLGFAVMCFFIFKNNKIVEIINKIILSIKNTLNPKMIISYIIYLISFSWIIGFIFEKIGLKDKGALLLLVILLFSLVLNPGKRNFFNLNMILLILRVIFDKNFFTYSFAVYLLAITSSWFLVYSLFNSYLINLLSNSFIKEIGINKLRKGMILNKRQNDKDDTNEAKYLIIDKYLKDTGENGIMESQIHLLKKKGTLKVSIKETIPFAPVLFIGAILICIIPGL